MPPPPPRPRPIRFRGRLAQRIQTAAAVGPRGAGRAAGRREGGREGRTAGGLRLSEMESRPAAPGPYRATKLVRIGVLGGAEPAGAAWPWALGFSGRVCGVGGGGGGKSVAAAGPGPPVSPGLCLTGEAQININGCHPT